MKPISRSLKMPKLAKMSKIILLKAEKVKPKTKPKNSNSKA